MIFQNLFPGVVFIIGRFNRITMYTKILEFRLTDHFMLRGWERSIDKPTLFKVLPFVEVSEAEKKLVVVTPSFWSKKGIIGKSNHCLVLVMKKDLIVTGYWCSNPNYLQEKEKQANFQWLYI